MSHSLKQFDDIERLNDIQPHKVYRIGSHYLISFDCESESSGSIPVAQEGFNYHLYDLDDRVYQTGFHFETLESARQDACARVSRL
jgi:hypothetical protein